MSSTRRSFLQTTSAASAASIFFPHIIHSATSKMNVVWITAEDICPDLGCYGESLVHTPNIDSLAQEGIRFTNAFTTSPVCSATRSAFMCGMYQTTIGAHHHRSHRDHRYILDNDIQIITHWFRQAGYFTANVKKINNKVSGSGKFDLNYYVEKPFDGDHWNQRDPGQPFFAHINFPETHRNFKQDPKHPINPDDVEVPPYYPEHPITRKDWALYLETANHLDRKVGAVIEALRQDNLLDNTLIFFFGDHGRPHVRGKQWLYDGGIHIPLIVRFPDGYGAGTVNDNLISAIDFAPTSLELAGLEAPAYMQGQAFLGDHVSKRDYVYSARDRCDETMDRIRSVRSKRYKYIRNFQPERPYSQLNRYKETQYPVIRLMRRLHAQGELAPIPAHYMAPERPLEELYDLQNDPHETKNLAGDPQHQATLQDMRSRLLSWIEETHDQGEIPEDPNITLEYKQKMQRIYDQRLIKIYKEEGMEEFIDKIIL